MTVDEIVNVGVGVTFEEDVIVGVTVTEAVGVRETNGNALG